HSDAVPGFSCAAARRGRFAPALRGRCGARRGGSVTRGGIETVAERRRFAQRTVHGRSPLRSTECEHSPPDRMTSRSTRDRPPRHGEATGETRADTHARRADWTHHDLRGEAASWTPRVQGGEAGAVICGFVRGQPWSRT